MAAVAAAAAAPITTRTATTDDQDPDQDPAEPAPLGPVLGPGLPGAPPDPAGPGGPEPEPGPEQQRQVGPELESAAGKAEIPENQLLNNQLINNFPMDLISVDHRFCPGLPGDPEPSAVFLHSVPDSGLLLAAVSEAGLGLKEPAEPTDRTGSAGQDRAHRDPHVVPVEGHMVLDSLDRDLETGTGSGKAGPEDPDRGLRDSPPRRAQNPDIKQEKPEDLEPRPGPGPGPGPGAAPLASLQDLSLGSEVRVCLDHVIDDALVVSFRFGEKVFSGVLMDVSKRFGPYGIPVTPFPRRDDRSRPPLSSLAPADPSPADDVTASEAPSSPPPHPPPHPWTTKPPPLFQEGAPYPPPLFIRDTYNQALPQPLPRKIKRPKRRYRCEEPTSIMNAIKLRPRQVLCDKCKGVVASGGHREARRGLGELRGDEASRRRRAPEGPISSEVKRLRSDDKTGRPADRRSASGIRVSTSSSSSSSSSSSRRVLRGVASSSPPSSRMCLKLNPKKVLAKGSDCTKARQVLKKLARSSTPPPQRRPKDQDQTQTRDQDQDQPKAVTRASTLQNHNQKVHFTRRLQNLGGASPNAALPPRMRLKPQRYRTDEGHAPSSPPTPKQSARSSPPKPALSPAPTSNTDPPSPQAPPTPPPPCVAVETPAEEEEEGAGLGEVEEAPPPCSTSLDSSHSESSTETFDLPPPGDPAPLPPPPPTSSSSSSSPPPPPPRPDGEEDEEEGESKRRRKSSTSSSSSSSSSSSVFSKLVSKCSLPDGRSVCVGDIVWAKIYGFPWWPARVLCITVSRRGDTGLEVRQEARVSWFGSPTTSFLPLAQLSPFLESFQSRFDRKRKGPYRRAIAEAASAAKQLTPEVRALLTQFET